MSKIEKYRLKPLEVEVLTFCQQNIDVAKEFVGAYLQIRDKKVTLWMERECRFKNLTHGDIIMKSGDYFTCIERWRLEESFEVI